MKVTKVIEEEINVSNSKRKITTEELQREVDYFRAEKILKSMFEKGLISIDEFNKITELNRKTFSPFLAEIMPLSP